MILCILLLLPITFACHSTPVTPTPLDYEDVNGTTTRQDSATDAPTRKPIHIGPGSLARGAPTLKLDPAYRPLVELASIATSTGQTEASGEVEGSGESDETTLTTHFTAFKPLLPLTTTMPVSSFHPLPAPNQFRAISSFKPLAPPAQASPPVWPATQFQALFNAPVERAGFKPLLLAAPLPTLVPLLPDRGLFGSNLLAALLPMTPPTKQETVFKMQVAPPVEWTFCDPFCGAGDQAADLDTALDNARTDIAEGLSKAYTASHLLAPDDGDVVVDYNPESTMLEEFGQFFDQKDHRYIVNGHAVTYRTHKDRNGELEHYYVEVLIRVKNREEQGVLTKRRIASELLQHLALHKGARFKDTIQVVE